MKTKTNKKISKCCGANVLNVSGWPKDEGNHYYQCTKCGNPCDLKFWKTKLKESSSKVCLSSSKSLTNLDKQKPKELDWSQKLKVLVTVAVADSLFAGKTRPITKDCSDVTVKHHKKISKFISQLLKTQREEIISEIEGIVEEDEKLHRMFWDSDIVNVEVKIRNELRKEIRERLKQI